MEAGEGTIVVAGEALVDLTVGDRGELADHLGGGPFNAARTVARLGQPVSYLGRLSTDRFGTRLRAALEQDGVDLGSAPSTDDPTTLALAELDENGAATYHFYTQGTSAPGLTTDDALRALPDQIATLCIGTLGLVLEPMATSLEAVVERYAESAFIVVDPNCRPSMVDDDDLYRERLKRIVAMSDLVKVSDQDLEWLDPGKSATDAARAMLDQGTQLVLLTMGGDGVTVVTPEGDTHLPAIATTVVDTIGAGDSFCGGFLAWWRRAGLGAADLKDTDQVVAAAQFACVVAAFTCGRAGANPPHESEVDF